MTLKILPAHRQCNLHNNVAETFKHWKYKERENCVETSKKKKNGSEMYTHVMIIHYDGNMANKLISWYVLTCVYSSDKQLTKNDH